MSTYYALLGGSRVLNIEGDTDYSLVDDGDVSDRPIDVHLILATNIHSDCKETAAST